jgi:hypothetical protein
MNAIPEKHPVHLFDIYVFIDTLKFNIIIDLYIVR